MKIKLNRAKMAEWSPVHYIFDILSGTTGQPISSSITHEMIVSLSENGVPDEVLVSMLRSSIQEVAEKLEPVPKPHGSQILWDSIYASHRVLQNKLRQVMSPEIQRAQGFFDFESDEDIEPEAIAPAKWENEADPYSGMPASSQEQVLGWLQAGFAPTDPFVMEKLCYLQKKLLSTAVEVGLCPRVCGCGSDESYYRNIASLFQRAYELSLSRVWPLILFEYYERTC